MKTIETYTKIINKKTLGAFGVLVFILINCVFCLLIREKAQIVFATNDDYRMRLIVSGAYTGIPNGQAIFLNPLFSHFLAFLYKLKPTIEWYGGFFEASLCFTAAISEYYLVSRAKSFRDFCVRLIACFFLSATVLINDILMPQFTVVAAYWVMLAIVSESAFFSYAIGEHKRSRILWGALFCFSVLMAVFLRQKVLLMSLPLIIGFGIVKRLGVRTREFFAEMAVIFIALILVSSSVAIHELYLYDEDFAKFQEFCEARSDVFDYTGIPDYEENLEFYTEIGFPKEAYDSLKGRTFDLNEEINTDNLEKIAEYARMINKKPFLERCASAFVTVVSMFSSSQVVRVFWGSIVTILLLMLLIKRDLSRTSTLLLWAAFLYIMVSLVGITFMGRIMERIVQAQLIFLIGATFAVVADENIVEANESNNQASVISKGVVKAKYIMLIVAKSLMVLTIFFSLFLSQASWLKDESALRSRTLILKTEMLYRMEEFMVDYPNGFLFYNALNFIGGSDYVYNHHHVSSPLNIESLGNWNNLSPTYYERNSNFGFTSARDAFMNKSDLFYAEIGSKSFNGEIKSTIEKMGLEWELVTTVYVKDLPLSIYRFHVKPSTGG